MKHLWFVVASSMALTACAPSDLDVYGPAEPSKPPVVIPPPPPTTNTNAQEQAFKKLLAYLNEQVKKQWGDDEFLQAGKHRYVKYLDGYRTRAHIDFDTGKIYVSTVSKYAPKETLKEAIVSTLLMPADPAQVDLFSDKTIPLNGKPFLLGQVKDHDGQDIQWEWRANRFADYLIENKLQSKPFKYGTAYYVQIDMVGDHLEQREYQYADLIKRASKQYGIDEDLIYAIVKTESSFNPFAVSHAGAYGLMQVIPKTAGADVFNLVKNKPGIPTKEYLFDPANNIDTGTAYFYILKNRYLKNVQHPTTKHYTMISAYNGGTGGVLATFDPDRDRAMNQINQLNPDQVYWALTNKHPKEEARRYLQKVLHFQKEFNNQ
ncbi:TPA: membrane-bound lytic murein transglycosylase MltC [Photobacterium damselae]|uniref:membrane-bound lytic murein transglycosylase MltC n=2 Tax=Photobacterium damselae TaxID=38293 RepID=UPI0010FDC193|nr:membrane-bound lytic murein transglycosylase MltC [Photobacterium damselae]EJN6959400.1 membrane-bound lytic murein transglycosylase MltC [Photobacterium damselae]KAB1508856.1 membrane-bound lytic murein transglycosylase MltC [Photobacterium damselae subsp. damselae]MCG3846664.1 membrane-bound lytic murein transglycosylase MltC [Photobacterium damselae]NVH45871.1 membrane-bound lytic murein transglycosylase MltC [Photobacterium damselae subsp. damselae]TLS79247.1 membrane-bound lytic murein